MLYYVRFLEYGVPCRIHGDIEATFDELRKEAACIVASQTTTSRPQMAQRAMQHIHELQMFLDKLPQHLLDPMATAMGRRRIGNYFLTHVFILEKLGMSKAKMTFYELDPKRKDVPKQMACVLRSHQNRACAVCQTDATKRCPRCHTPYCCRAHQKAHWHKHQDVCMQHNTYDEYIARMVYFHVHQKEHQKRLVD